MSKKKTPPKKPKTKRAIYTPVRDPYNLTLIKVYTHGGQWRPTPTNMPSHMTILGQKFRVYYHTRIFAETVQNSRLLGVVLYPNRMIIIDPDQTMDDMKEVLYHEAGHVYIKAWQAKSEPLSKLTYHQVEHFCDLMGEAVCDLARNNPPVPA
jgi:hypothetical protein